MPRELCIGNGSLLIAFDSQYRVADFYFPHVGMENHAASSIYGNTTHAPYLNNTLLPMSGRATNFIDTLPSLPRQPTWWCCRTFWWPIRGW